MAIVAIITNPPCKASILGCSFIINHTQIGPIIVSKRKKRLTSSAGINLGAIVTKTNGIATHITHIKGTNILSLPTRAKKMLSLWKDGRRFTRFIGWGGFTNL